MEASWVGAGRSAVDGIHRLAVADTQVNNKLAVQLPAEFWELPFSRALLIFSFPISTASTIVMVGTCMRRI